MHAEKAVGAKLGKYRIDPEVVTEAKRLSKKTAAAMRHVVATEGRIARLKTETQLLADRRIPNGLKQCSVPFV